VKATSHVRSWPVIVVSLIAVFGIGLGIGVAVTHGTMSAKVSSARDAERRAQQVAAQQQHVNEANRRLAVMNAERARLKARLALLNAQRLVQRVPMCDREYPAPRTPHESELFRSCVDPIRRGVSPETPQPATGA